MIWSAKTRTRKALPERSEVDQSLAVGDEMYRIQTELTGLGGAPYLSTHYFEEGAPGAEPAHAAVATFWTNLREIMVTNIVWTVLGDIDVISASTGQVTDTITVPSVAGTGNAGSAPVPLASQGLVRWRTGTFVAGRRVLGKTYVPGISQGGLAGGQVTPSVVAQLTAAGSTLVASPAAALVIYSRANGLEAPVSGASGWNQFAVLRSRRD